MAAGLGTGVDNEPGVGCAEAAAVAVVGPALADGAGAVAAAVGGGGNGTELGGVLAAAANNVAEHKPVTKAKENLRNDDSYWVNMMYAR